MLKCFLKQKFNTEPCTAIRSRQQHFMTLSMHCTLYRAPGSKRFTLLWYSSLKWEWSTKEWLQMF